jgi:DNA mismatch endonuclease (patch repair protein)
MSTKGRTRGDVVKRILPTAPPATSAAVSAVMRGNKKTNTSPELIVRRSLSALGYRYRVNGRDLPGSPDIVFVAMRKAIFVHGCFWHQHRRRSCPLRSAPRSNLYYWRPKLKLNQDRDKKVLRTLRARGWHVTIIWECETERQAQLARRLTRFLDA